jgi:hypothetical protein
MPRQRELAAAADKPRGATNAVSLKQDATIKKSNGNFTLVLCLVMIRSQNGAGSPLRLFLLLCLGWLQYHLNSRIEDTLYVLQIRWAEERPLVCLHIVFCICSKQLSR